MAVNDLVARAIGFVRARWVRPPPPPLETLAAKRRGALERLRRRSRQLLLVEDVYVLALVINVLVVAMLAASWVLSPGPSVLPVADGFEPWIADLSPSTLLWSLGWVPGSWLFERARWARNRRRWTRAAQLALASGDPRAKELVLLSLRGR